MKVVVAVSLPVPTDLTFFRESKQQLVCLMWMCTSVCVRVHMQRSHTLVCRDTFFSGISVASLDYFL